VEHYNSYRSYIKKRFGQEVLKVPLSGGFSCPNRDGMKSHTGCLFCDNRSFSPAALKIESPVNQLRAIISKTSHRYSAFIPYLQPFSNTYGTVEQLKAVYEPLLEIPDVVGIAIGTRPDCFSNAIYDYLYDLSKRTYLSIELGLQSGHNITLKRCNRGHTVEEFSSAIKRLAQMSIETVAHVMLGLPGECTDMMIKTAQYIASVPVSGVKIHQLMIISGTEFELMYNEGLLNLFTIEEYADILCQFIENLRPDQLIHRIMADSKPDFGLIAPLWSANKSASINVIHRIMNTAGCKQGIKQA
jgi:radical SAM protein (TIGR01212 family)